MKTEDTSKTPEDTAKEGKAEGRQGFPEMCHQMTGGELPLCCKAQMKDMMAQWMSRLQGGDRT